MPRLIQTVWIVDTGQIFPVSIQSPLKGVDRRGCDYAFREVIPHVDYSDVEIVPSDV